MAQPYVYTTPRLTKAYPSKTVREDISLSFLPGAKIGVLGLNGAGKSTLLRIMAGIDTEIEGEARPQPNLRIGFLQQEPKLDPNKNVRGNVEDGCAEIKAKLDAFDAVSMRMAEPMSDDEMNALLGEQARLQDAIE